MAAQLHGTSVLLYAALAAYLALTVIAGGAALLGRRPPAWFWLGAWLALVLALVEAGAGILQVIGGTLPTRGLHILYGLLVVAAGTILYGLRPGGYIARTTGRNDVGGRWTPALIALTQVALLLRAWMTGQGLR